jgi:hypothetical protein
MQLNEMIMAYAVFRDRTGEWSTNGRVLIMLTREPESYIDTLTKKLSLKSVGQS